MTNQVQDQAAMAAETMTRTADAGSRESRPTWSRPELAEVDIASVTLAMGPGVVDGGFFS